MSEWISVKDKMPEEDEDVLVFHIGKFIGVASLMMLYGRPLFWINGCSVKAKHITHWMPLPSPPKD